MNATAPVKAFRLILLSLVVCWVTSAYADKRSVQEQAGDAAYSRKAYDSAISYYEQALTPKTPDAVVLYKLGNAHYRLKHTGEAMLSYERALLHQPGFAAAAENARLIQQQVEPAHNKEIFFLRWWRAITAAQLSNIWALLAILLVAAMLLSLGWDQYKRKRSAWNAPRILISGFVAASVFIVFSLAGAWRDVPRSAAVIMRPDTKFRPANNSKGTALSLPEGLLVKILNMQKDEAIVELPDGQQGFVQRFDIAAVE